MSVFKIPKFKVLTKRKSSLLVELDGRIATQFKDVMQTVSRNVTNLKSDLQQITTRMEGIESNVSSKLYFLFLATNLLSPT